MPPEPFPWDRRDFRKHERSVSDPRFGGGFGGGGPPRWREQHAPPSHPPPYHHHQQQQRRYSDFRSRPLPPGHGKHTGWHVHTDEAGHGFPPYGSRLGDRSIGEENYRPFGSCSDGGRHFRNNRESRGSFSQKYWRANSWETASSPNIPVRSVEASDKRFTENTQAGHTSNDADNGSERNLPALPPDSASKTENPQSILKDQHIRDVGNVEVSTSTEKEGKESHLGSISWNPLKWSRSGSLSSRGSSLSRSSSSKSVGVDYTETATEVQQKQVAPIQSPTEDAPTKVKVDTLVPSEETSSRKKPRLGWGEGLAKYEKKKVDGPEDNAIKSSVLVRVNDIQETVLSHPPHDKSPRFVDTSPAIPLPIVYSSSPVVDEKDFMKAAISDIDSTNLSCPPSISSHTPAPCEEGSLCSSDNLYLSSVSGVSSLIDDMLVVEDPSLKDIPHVSVNELSWKSVILKKIERTEAEIDSLETELRLLICDPPSSWSHPDTSSSQGHCDKEVVCSNSASSPAPLLQDMSGDKNFDDATISDGDKLPVLDENISTDCIILKCIEMPSSGEDLNSHETSNTVVDFEVNNFSNSDKFQNNKDSINSEQKETSICGNFDTVHVMPYDMQNVCDSIMASNQDLAIRAFEPLNKFLPAKQHTFDAAAKSSALCLQRSSLVARKNFLTMKQLVQFKEKALAIKYKLFQHFWVQDRIVSVRKLRAMSFKNYDLIGHKKHRYSRSRMSASAWNTRFVSVDDVVEVVKGLLSDSLFERSRNVLKMPSLMLDRRGMRARFMSDNGLVEDCDALENDRSLINTWTSDEREIFLEKLATFGKNFGKIASFLDHKNTADCVEFYYKNHRKDWFSKTWKKPDVMKQSKPRYLSYLLTSGKKWNREAAVASLDLLGEASAIMATVDAVENCEKSPSKIFLGVSHSSKASRSYGSPLPRSNSPGLYSSEREAAAADVLAGICGSLSSEAMSSCITSSVDHGDGYHDWRCQRVGFASKSPFTPEVTQNVDDECSDESCGELDSVDWSDEEKSIFVQALSTYGRDFVMISDCVRTRSRDQCKVFFSKARKCLELDSIQPELDIAVSGDVNGGGSDIEDPSALERNLVICDVGLECKIEKDLSLPVIKLNHEAGDVSEETLNMKPHLEHSSVDDGQINETNCSSVPSVGESILRVQTSDCSLPKSIESENLALVEVLVTNNGKVDQETEILSSNKNVEQIDVNSTNISAAKVKTGSQLAGNYHPSLTLLRDDSGYRKSDQEYPIASKSYADSLQLGDHSASSLKSSTLFSVPIEYSKLANPNSTSSGGVNVGSHMRSDHVEPTHILRGYPVSVPVVSEEKSRSSSCSTMVAHQNAPSLDGNLRSNYHDFSLQKCNSRHHCEEEEISCASLEKTNQSRTGDVKLFGKILSSQQKPNASGEQKADSNNQNCKSVCSTLNPNCGEQKAILDSAVKKFDYNNSLGSENTPIVNFGYWDRNRHRIQTGSPSLPDSTLLLAKYPAAFANYPKPTAKMEQPAVHHTLRSAEYLNNREVQPFTLDVKNPRDRFFSKMQQHPNMLNVATGIQQQSRPVTGRGGVVGGQCSGISDPVAAIKMHYAKAERFSLQAGNVIEEDETWMSKRDLDS